MSYKREEIMGLLVNDVVTVEFIKSTGELRKMKCTLKEGIVPPAEKSEVTQAKKVRKVSEDVIPVWDTEKESWRSFRVDSVKFVAVEH